MLKFVMRPRSNQAHFSAQHVYSAERTGAKGRRFRCYKFRSMVSNAQHLKEELRDRNQREGPIFKIDDDPRITRIGRIIRRYSLDELPQLWNGAAFSLVLASPLMAIVALLIRLDSPGPVGDIQQTLQKQGGVR
jgi:lipopolysaccharide/colanic/teichoic acid biosynthesis glycosyltransferase